MNEWKIGSSDWKHRLHFSSPNIHTNRLGNLNTKEHSLTHQVRVGPESLRFYSAPRWRWCVEHASWWPHFQQSTQTSCKWGNTETKQTLSVTQPYNRTPLSYSERCSIYWHGCMLSEHMQKRCRTAHYINSSIPCFIALHFSALRRYCIFYKLKFWGNSVSNKSIGPIFPTVFAHLVSLGHILRILAIFQAFSLSVCLFWWSVTTNLWCYYCRKIMTLWRLRWWLAFF